MCILAESKKQKETEMMPSGVIRSLKLRIFFLGSCISLLVLS